MKQRDHCCCLLSHSTMKQSFQQCSNMLLSNIPKLNFSQLFNNYDCYIVRFTLLCSIVFFLDRKRKENFFFFGPELIDNEHIVWFVQTQKDISFSSQFVVGNEEKKNQNLKTIQIIQYSIRICYIKRFEKVLEFRDYFFFFCLVFFSFIQTISKRKKSKKSLLLLWISLLKFIRFIDCQLWKFL